MDVSGPELYRQARTHIDLYKRTGSTQQLDQAAQALRRASAAGISDRETDTAVLIDLAMTLQLQYGHTRMLNSLAEAAEAYRQALAELPGDHPQRGAVATNLAQVLRELRIRTRDASLIPAIVQAARDAVEANPAGPPDREARLMNLAAALGEQFELTGEGDPREMITVCRQAIPLTPALHLNRVLHQTNLTGALLRASFNDLQALDEAVKVGRDAVAGARRLGHPRLVAALLNLAQALKVRYEHTGERALLLDAVALGREAMAICPEQHPERPALESNLVSIYRTHAVLTGDARSARTAVEIDRARVASVAQDDPDRSAILGGLGESLRAQFLASGDSNVLAEAAETARRAAEICRQDDPQRAARLHGLCVLLQMRAEQTGDLSLAEDAIAAGQGAVALLPEGHRDMAQTLSSLSVCYQTVYALSGNTSALAHAVEHAYRAIDACPMHSPQRPAHLNMLGAVLQLQAEHTQSIDLLRQAVAAEREAVADSLPDDPARAIRAANLALALRTLYDQIHDENLLHEAHDLLREAMVMLPIRHHAYAVCLNSLTTVLRTLFDATGERRFLTEAVDAGQRAVEATPGGLARRATLLGNLAEAQLRLSQQTGDSGMLRDAFDNFKKAGSDASGDITARLVASRQAAILARAVGAEPGEALALVEMAVDLLPRLTPRSLVRADREFRLGRLGSLAGLAAAIAVDAGDPERAVELLERTRGILVADALDARSSDLTRLREQTPDLAAEFEALRARFDDIDRSFAATLHEQPPAGLHTDAAATLRQQLQAAWTRLIERIRSINGFAGFLATPSIDDLALLADNGPVVLVYSSPLRCDALILRNEPHRQVEVVPLTGMSEADLQQRVERLATAQQTSTDPDTDPRTRIHAQHEILDLLAWSWDNIAGPVLTALGFTTPQSHTEPLPRVWWCPTGMFTRLPLHAAGHHEDAENTAGFIPRSVLDTATSSYTTTLRGLAAARSQPARPVGPTLVVVVLAAPETPRLHYAQREAETVSARISDAVVLTDPTHEDVVRNLQHNEIAHFACHTSVNQANPAASKLLLMDHQTSPLTVAELSTLRTTGALAYLSTCETAVTSDGLIDEAVHITGGFYLAGYQHVIGTLWPTHDSTAPTLADDFYERLTANEAGPPEIARSADALRHAVHRMRRSYPKTPSAWAAHTHTGI